MSATATPEAIRPAILDAPPTKLFIDGQWVPARSGATFEAHNPSTGEVIAHVAEGRAEDVDLAVAAARRALEGPWASFSPVQRQRLMLDFADRVEARIPELTALDSYDMGFPIGFGAIAGDSLTPASIIRDYAGWTNKFYGATTQTPDPDMFSYTLRQPAGVVGAIVPWNSPRFLTSEIAPVLATGCTMVLKPSELGSLAPIVIMEILAEVGVPDGVINLVTGFGGEAGAAIAAHPDVDMISFTGSTATGQRLVRASADSNLKRLFLELGGKSPVIICADADLEVTIPTAAMGVFGNTGQMCTAGSRAFVERSIYDDVVAGFAQVAQSLKVGSALDPATTMGPLVSSGQLDRVTGYMDLGREEGVSVAAGGVRKTTDGLADGYFVEPTVFADARDDMRVATEEIFGPVACLMPFDDLEDTVRRANTTKYGLGAGVFTRDMGKAHRLAREIKSGVVWINTYMAYDPAMPFGGRKMSGWGSKFGPHSVDHYLDEKAVWMQLPAG